MKKKFSVLINKKILKFKKNLKVPADKSLSIRALLISSQCIGISKINNLSESEDVITCINALKTLGVKIIKNKNIYKVFGNGLNSFNINKKIKIFIGNSGTTARLLSGLLATYPGKFYLYGDESMNKRDMSRVIYPLEKIGAFFFPKGKKTLPITIHGTKMPLAQTHIERLGSAQVKSSIMLAALNTPGTTIIEEKKISRDHTEIFLNKILANIKVKKLNKNNLININGLKNLYSFNYAVSSDPSSAAFLIVLTLLTPGSELKIKNVLCNKNRIGFIKILKEKMNANIKIKNLRKDSASGELVGNIVTKSSALKAVKCPRELVPSLIDELPILFVAAALTKGISKFEGIHEATKKESNRVVEMQKVLSQAGIKCKITKDSMTIYGREKMQLSKKNIVVETKGDHRICMSAAILSLITGIKANIKNFETVNTSFPKFISIVKKIGGDIVIR